MFGVGIMGKDTGKSVDPFSNISKIYRKMHNRLIEHNGYDISGYSENNPFEDDTIKEFRKGDVVKLGLDGYDWVVDYSGMNVTICRGTVKAQSLSRLLP